MPHTFVGRNKKTRGKARPFPEIAGEFHDDNQMTRLKGAIFGGRGRKYGRIGNAEKKGTDFLRDGVVKTRVRAREMGKLGM